MLKITDLSDNLDDKVKVKGVRIQSLEVFHERNVNELIKGGFHIGTPVYKLLESCFLRQEYSIFAFI